MYLWRTKTMWRETGRGTRDSCDVTVCWVDCFATSLLMLSEHTGVKDSQQNEGIGDFGSPSIIFFFFSRAIDP